MPRTASSPQITSKGCSRGFILCVLYRALDYVRQRQMLGHTVQFPFFNDEIVRWLQVSCIVNQVIASYLQTLSDQRVGVAAPLERIWSLLYSLFSPLFFILFFL